jgi:hypothetical protein
MPSRAFTTLQPLYLYVAYYACRVISSSRALFLFSAFGADRTLIPLNAGVRFYNVAAFARTGELVLFMPFCRLRTQCGNAFSSPPSLAEQAWDGLDERHRTFRGAQA